jgi:NAD(P)-dependent dehydrogenase (short-subunit alcohol dehydrogenase family)
MDALYKVHFKGAFFLRQKLLPLINGGGRIVNIASGLTRITIPEVCLYVSFRGRSCPRWPCTTTYMAFHFGQAILAKPKDQNL